MNRKSQNLLQDQSGQTVVEYLFLLAMTFITAYLFLTFGPLPTFTASFLNDVSTRLRNVVRNAEMDTRGSDIGRGGHPADPKRLKALHL